MIKRKNKLTLNENNVNIHRTMDGFDNGGILSATDKYYYDEVLDADERVEKLMKDIVNGVPEDFVPEEPGTGKKISLKPYTEKVNRRNKKRIMESSDRPIATYPISNWGGIEIFDINHGIDDEVVYSWFGGKKETAIINYDEDRPFFMCGDMKIYLDDCMRLSESHSRKSRKSKLHEGLSYDEYTELLEFMDDLVDAKSVDAEELLKSAFQFLSSDDLYEFARIYELRPEDWEDEDED